MCTVGMGTGMSRTPELMDEWQNLSHQDEAQRKTAKPSSGDGVLTVLAEDVHHSSPAMPKA